MAIHSSNEALASGLDVLNAVAQLKRTSTGPSAPDDAAWQKWAGCELLELWQLVALHSWVDPDSIGTSPEAAVRTLRRSPFSDTLRAFLGHPIDTRPIARLQRNFASALAALRLGDLAPAVSGIGLGARTWIRRDEFAVWATRVALPVVGDWVARHERGATEHAWVAEFPYKTRQLELALKVARDLAPRYLHKDLARAPSSEEAVRHVIEHYGVSLSMARAVVRLIRPNNLPVGRRRKSPTEAMRH